MSLGDQRQVAASIFVAVQDVAEKDARRGTPVWQTQEWLYLEIHRDHPEHALWACELSDPSAAMLEFQK